MKIKGLISGSLAIKLILTVGALIIIGGGISWYALINTSKNNLLDNAVTYTASLSDLVKRSTRYSMISFHRDTIQQIVKNIGDKKDIEKIRIFDSKGKIFYSSEPEEISHIVERDSFACFACHTDPESPSETLKDKNQWTIFRSNAGNRILTYIDPIYNEPSCYTPACHVHPREQRVLGVLETEFSLASVDKSIWKLIVETSLYAVVYLSVSSIILFLVLRIFVYRPVSTLSTAIGKVEAGDLSHEVHITSEDEIGQLGNAFNMMTKELERAREKMESWTQSLEEAVKVKTAKLKESQDKLIQSEKLASLGRLTSDVAHEIRNPLTAIGGFARRLYRLAGDRKEKEYAEIVLTEVNRLEKVLRDVLTFSRDARFHLERHDMTKIIFETLTFYKALCKEKSIHIKEEKGEGLPPIIIDKDQVRQALSNLITNAIDAMPDGGILTVTADNEDLHNVPYICIKVSDSGQGISEEKLDFIFEPFFSTKELHGTGLGLSITRKIVEEHGGFVKAESTQGKGTAISLYFPYQSEEESLNIKCWEYMKCGRDKDATLKCPAYPYFGRVCWAVAGTFCEGKVMGTFAQKYENCENCIFYQKVERKDI